jgi:hypothetical protein
MKIEYRHIPPKVLRALAEVLTHGARPREGDRKQRGSRGWREMYARDPQGTRDIYTDSLFRHFEDYRSGKKKDEDTGFHPLAHLLANALILLDIEQLDDDKTTSSRRRDLEYAW